MGYGRSGGGRKEYDNANRISLWENDRARDGKRDPELKGSATEVECPCCGEKTDYWVSLWENQSNGSGSRAPVLSGKVEPKEADNGRGGSDRSSNRRDQSEPRRYGGGGRSNDRDEPRASRRDDDDEPRRSRNATVDPLDEEIPF